MMTMMMMMRGEREGETLSLGRAAKMRLRSGGGLFHSRRSRHHHHGCGATNRVHQHSSGLQIHSIGSLWNKFANRVAAAAMRMRATVGHARHCYSRRLLQLLLPLGGMQRKSQNHHSARPSHLPKSASARKATKAFGNLRVAAEGKETEGRQTRKIDQCQSLHLSYSTSNKLCLPLWQIHATKLMRCI